MTRSNWNTCNEVNISVDEKTRWKINKYLQAYFEDVNLLKTGDVIWLNHSEKKAILAVQKIVSDYRNIEEDSEESDEFDIQEAKNGIRDGLRNPAKRGMSRKCLNSLCGTSKNEIVSFEEQISSSMTESNSF